MLNKFKEYLEYRKNKKIAKRELAIMAANTLPVIREVSGKGTETIKFFAKLVDETKNINGERLVEIVLKEVASALQTDNNRLIEILTYMVNLSPEDMRKILIHSVVESGLNDNKDE